MNYEQFLTEFSFRFVGPDVVRDNDGWHSIVRPDGSRVRLLGLPGIPLDLFNAVVPGDESRIRFSLRELCSIPKMSTFAIGAIVNQAVARLPRDHSFVNVGVWNGFTFLCGLAGNPESSCVGVDNFSQFGGPRDAFLARFESRRSARHQFHDLDYAEYFAQVHQGPIGVYIYDGEHSYANQLKGLRAAEPFFAEDCLVLVDDTNWLEPWQATVDFVEQSPHEYRLLLDRTTAHNAHPSFWNGLMILQRTGRAKSAASGIISSGEFRRAETMEPKPPSVSWRDALAPEQRRQAPLISLVIVHSRAEADLEAMIAGALNLTYPNVELIIVDETRSDRSREIMADGSGRFIAIRREAASDLSGAFQAGLQASHGEWIAFLDSERPLISTALEVALNFGRDVLGCTHSEPEWYDRTARALIELMQIVPPNEAAILVDDTQLGLQGIVAGRRLLPFLECDGVYNGQPADDASAIRELERLRGMGANYIAFTWPCFWWLEHYARFQSYLREQFPCVIDNERVVVFSLQR